MAKKARRINRLWSSCLEANTFHVIGSIVPKTGYTLMDSVKMQSDLSEYCDVEFKGHKALCGMLDRLQRDFGD